LNSITINSGLFRHSRRQNPCPNLDIRALALCFHSRFIARAQRYCREKVIIYAKKLFYVDRISLF
jgi:hypothetical protein